MANGVESERGRGGLDALFASARDENGDVDLQKIPESVPSVMADRLRAADTNGDGKLNAEELAVLRASRGAAETPTAPTQPKKRTSISSEERGDLETLRIQMIRDGVEYLSSAQLPSGSFSTSPRVGIGPTIIDTIGLLRVGIDPESQTASKALQYLSESIREDGGIYSEGGHISCYESCLGAVCFDLANKACGDGRYDGVVSAAEAYIRRAQYGESNGYSSEDEYFGGVGYGDASQSRPDLSNTQFFVEALRELGAQEDDPALQDALVFVSRCQNLESEDNPAKGEGKSDDGGFIYTFVSGGENPAGQEVSGGLRSYGSMTYAGLKSLIYAGLSREDPRVSAAVRWIGENYTMSQNPGLGRKGLFYYYHTLSKCFQALGDDFFTDAKGNVHDWRAELIETLALSQNADGSWVNDERMWYETDANLVTGYVLIVLSYCTKTEK